VINKKIMKLLHGKMGISPSGIYTAIGNKKKQFRYSVSKETAAYVLAAEKGIDISKYLSEEELSRVREATRTAPIIIEKPTKKEKSVKRVLTVKFSDDLRISCPNVPESVLRDAKKMSGVYPYLYIFENSIRYFIKNILEEVYGQEWWVERIEKSKGGQKIVRKAENRRTEEGRNRWHGSRGDHPIFYIDIDDLTKIVTMNFDYFKDKLPGVKRPIEWLTNRIEEIAKSRNVIAHNNPLSNDDIQRVKLYFNDWRRYMSNSELR